jgi:DNA polymerase-3 subunit alpha
MSKKEAEGMWEIMAPFAAYGFNKAHSASYGMVAYWTGYMKANYTVEYMTALLTAESNDKEKISAAVNECRRMGIEVMPPDINQSEVDFTIVENKGEAAIRFGLSAIKNVGEAAIETIMEARKVNEFTSFADFITRVDNRKVNKRVVESLIKVGAMSSFGTRAGLLSSMDEVRSRVGRTSKVISGQQGLFAEEDEQALKTHTVIIESNLEEFNDAELEVLERQLLGFSLTAKPLAELIEALANHATHKINDIAEINHHSMVKIAGIVSEVRIVQTRKTGAEMAFVRVEDDTGIINLVVFPKIFSDTKNLWTDNSALLISGKLDQREEEVSILVDSVETEDNLDSGGELLINVPPNTSLGKLRNLKQVLLDSPGNQEVTLVFEGKTKNKVKLPFQIFWSRGLARAISEILN